MHSKADVSEVGPLGGFVVSINFRTWALHLLLYLVYQESTLEPNICEPNQAAKFISCRGSNNRQVQLPGLLQANGANADLDKKEDSPECLVGL